MKTSFVIQTIVLTSLASLVAGTTASTLTCQRISDQARFAGLSSCQYAQQYCSPQAYFIDYYSIYYCSSPGIAFPLITLVSITLLLLLSSTADQFLMPTVKHICLSLNLPPSVAGVTLLAFGNSAPDIFTSLAGMKSADVSLVLSSLVGAGVCITTLCLGLVLCIGRPSIENPIWLVRDVVAYLLATAVIISVCETRQIELWHGLAFIVLYLVYAGSVIFSFAYDLIPGKKLSSEPIEDDASALLLLPNRNKLNSSSQTFQLYDFGPEFKPLFDPEPQLSSLPSPQDSIRSKVTKLREIAELPFTAAREVTIPKLEGDFAADERQRLVLAPLAISVLFSVSFLDSSIQTMPNYLMVGGLLASVGAYSCLPLANRPKPTLLLAFVGFMSSIAWISIFASEMVAVVQAVGVFCNISSAVLGLTVLAVASSFGDLMTNVTLAHHGGAASAVSACFGAPIMNDLLGLGIALSLACLQTYPAPIQFSIDPHVNIGWAFLVGSLIVNLLGFLLYRFQPGRSFGLALLAVYAVFIATTVFVI